MRLLTFVLSLFLLITFASIEAEAKERDPCDKNQNLKGWAKKAGYPGNYCAGTDESTPVTETPTSDTEASTTVTETPTPDTEASTPVTEAEVSVASLTLSWSVPSFRENGETLELYEINGYEILFKKVGEPLYYSENITDAQTTELVLSGLNSGDYEFKIAAIDSEGLYSSYAVATVFVQ